MHGRIKVRTSEEQQLLKKQEQQKKLLSYRSGLQQILSTRNCNSYDPNSEKLSGHILLINPDIYTLWNYRKEVIVLKITESNGDLNDYCENELKLTEQCLIQNPKSYGAWYHRFWVLDRHSEPNWSHEFDLCTKYLTLDDRNFHCWDYRRLIINKIGIPLTKEIEFSTECLNRNFSNYSSWHYRSTLLSTVINSAKHLEMEINLVINAIFTDPQDSSSWFYLRWILNAPICTIEKKRDLEDLLKELNEMEPHCKWVVLTRFWLSKNSSLLNELLRQLIKLDVLRKGYYNDLVSISD